MGQQSTWALPFYYYNFGLLIHKESICLTPIHFSSVTSCPKMLRKAAV